MTHSPTTTPNHELVLTEGTLFIMIFSERAMADADQQESPWRWALYVPLIFLALATLAIVALAMLAPAALLVPISMGEGAWEGLFRYVLEVTQVA